MPPNRGESYLDRYVRRTLAQESVLLPCPLDPLSPGLTWNAQIGLGRSVPLPRTFRPPDYLQQETGRVIGGNFESGVRWRQGLGFRGGGQVWTTETQTAMIRIGPESYADLILGEDWALVGPVECVLQIAGVPARVLVFELESGRFPRQYGFTAHWRTRSWRGGALVLADAEWLRDQLVMSLQLASP